MLGFFATLSVMLRCPLSSCQLSSSSGYFNILYIMHCEFIRILRKINVIILILTIETLVLILKEKGNRMCTSSSREISSITCRDGHESLCDRLLARLSKRGAPSSSSRSLLFISSLSLCLLFLFDFQLATSSNPSVLIDLLLIYG